MKVALDYYDGGTRQSYDLPDLSIAARGTYMLDVGELVASGTPDRDGEVIPHGVSFGGYRVEKVGPNFIGNLTTEALVVDRRGGVFLSVYNTGCCHTNAQFYPVQVSGLVGDTAQFTITASNVCTGAPVYLSGNYSSGNTSVATVSGSGWISLVGAGTATVFGSISHMVGDFTFEPTCTNTFESGTCGVTAKPWLGSSVTIGAKVTYNGNDMVECDGTNDGPRWGYSRCLTYQLLDQSGTAIQGGDFTVEEEFVTVASNPSGIPGHNANNLLGSDGSFQDFLAFVAVSAPAPQQGEFVKQRQTFVIRNNISNTTYQVRINCLSFQHNDVTVTDITGGGICQ